MAEQDQKRGELGGLMGMPSPPAVRALPLGALPLKKALVGRKGYQRPRGINRLSQDKVDAFYMRQAMALAEEAEAAGEVPVGCLLVYRGQVLGRGRNRVEAEGRLAHAEMVCLQEALANHSPYELAGATLYVTLEPCPMCAGAILNSRVHRLVYGAADPRMGACGSSMDVFEQGKRFVTVQVSQGLYSQAISRQLSQFFKGLRQDKGGKK